MSVSAQIILVVLCVILAMAIYALGRCHGWLQCYRQHAKPALDGWTKATEWRQQLLDPLDDRLP